MRKLLTRSRKLWLHVTPGEQPESETRGRQNKQKVETFMMVMIMMVVIIIINMILHP